MSFSNNGQNFQKEEAEKEDLIKFTLEERKSVDRTISVTKFFLDKEVFSDKFTSSEKAERLELIERVVSWAAFITVLFAFIGIITGWGTRL